MGKKLYKEERKKLFEYTVGEKRKLILVIKTIKSLKVYLYSKLKSQTIFSIFHQGHTKSNLQMG